MCVVYLVYPVCAGVFGMFVLLCVCLTSAALRGPSRGGGLGGINAFTLQEETEAHSHPLVFHSR